MPRYQHGLRHREDGPAVEWSNGYTSWYKNNALHREDGPAIKYSTGAKEWWLNNKKYTEDEFVLLQFSKGIKTNECV